MLVRAVAVLAVMGLVSALPLHSGRNDQLAVTPPMGWMSWEVFRCDIDCTDDPDNCVSENLYKQMADHLVSDGYLEAGYTTVSIDDCWEQQTPPRDSAGRLTPNATRFPSGFKALGDYMHQKGVRFGIYSDMGTKTCGGYPGSKGYEAIDAKTFAEWGVDYLKLDGCNNDDPGFVEGYPAMGLALQESGREIVYSCSWPAYLGDNETSKPFDAMIMAGCNLWRNWHDIQGNWDSVVSIIDHWGDYGMSLQAAAGPTGPFGGHWNDMDMLLIGEAEGGGLPGISFEEGKTQFGMWSMLAAPLIMGNDLRNVTDAARSVLLNFEVIAVDQDSLGKQGLRLTPKGDQEVWMRELSGGCIAIAFLNKGDASAEISASLSDCQWPHSSALVRDLLERKDVGVVGPSGIKATVPSHGLKMYRFSVTHH